MSLTNTNDSIQIKSLRLGDVKLQDFIWCPLYGNITYIIIHSRCGSNHRALEKDVQQRIRQWFADLKLFYNMFPGALVLAKYHNEKWVHYWWAHSNSIWLYLAERESHYFMSQWWWLEQHINNQNRSQSSNFILKQIELFI